MINHILNFNVYNNILIIDCTYDDFSDGVTTIKKSLFNIIQEWIEPKYTDEDLKLAVEKYQHCPPNTKESLYYRYVYKLFKLLHPYIYQIKCKYKLQLIYSVFECVVNNSYVPKKLIGYFKSQYTHELSYL